MRRIAWNLVGITAPAMLCMVFGGKGPVSFWVMAFCVGFANFVGFCEGARSASESIAGAE